ncbi:Aste57867_8125 [Aphanomyces stellatus]|uniref:Aste57867_8125 protein n=1 Tax=Aphanomyces stellatus TaxID=120398 RepID=A0A485KJF4_9STRA|nr:hypothetical protein As57867_008095 [Aphanomyces stellatus]VFT85014.1 Aste57867_8125 [Aphanomyces stellatus]
MDDYALMCAPSSVDELRETLGRLEARWKSIRQRPRNRPTSVSPAMRPPSPLLRSYTDSVVDSNAYATPPTYKYNADGSRTLVSRSSSPDFVVDVVPPTVPIYVYENGYSTPQKKRMDPDAYDSPASVASSNSVSRPVSGSSRLPIAPGRRVAALTRENVSRLQQYPLHSPLDRDGGGSVCSSQSVKSRMSVKTDGGAVFSRLYKPNHLQDRDMRMSMYKDRQQSNLSFMPKTNSRQRSPSVASRDSFCSQSSCTSVQTDITGGLSSSSRLYDPDYIKKRHARLEKLKEERELRECTFAPAVNKNVNEKLLTNKEARLSNVYVPSATTPPSRSAATRRIK